MKRKSIVFSVAVLCLSAISAKAGMWPSSLQGVLDDITIAPNYHDSSVNVATDMLPDVEGSGYYDSYWSITAAGGSVSTVIIELCSYPDNQTFGVFDYADPSKLVEIFAGTDGVVGGVGSQATLSLLADGSVRINGVDSGIDFAGNLFGYYLDSSASAGGGVFYSDTALNIDGVDHMFAYQGTNTDTVQLPGYVSGLWTPNEFILAFEDTLGGGNYDHEDLVVMVESVKPIPVPGAVLLGVLGLGVAGWKLRKFA